VDTFGRLRQVTDLRPDDFGRLRAKAARRLGPFALAKYIQMVRTIFIFGFKSELLSVPVRFGDQFDKPSKKVMRLERAKNGPKLIDAATAWKLLDAASQQLRAMILLGLNAAYGQTDCSGLQRTTLAARPGWIDAPRQKTGVARRCPLWPETIAALEEVRRVRPEPKDPADANCVFITYKGYRWVKFTDHGDKKRGTRNDSAGQAFKALAKSTGVKVPGGMYTLRHVFRTVADETKDRAAVDLIMGHVDASMAADYREHIADDRLKAVVNYVRRWLLAGKPKAVGRKRNARTP
jgi:integrase